MNKRLSFVIAVGLLILAACGPAADDNQASGPTAEAGGGVAAFMEGQPRVDDQGAVTVTVTPMGRPAADGSLAFEVAMNTHSVDLVMPLAALATLTSDSGLSLPADSWDGPQGGHHVSGTLTFALTPEQLKLLESAGSLTLTIRDVDAPERKFSW